MTMTIEERVKRIRELDQQQDAIDKEKDKLYKEGLTREQHNKLIQQVMDDRQSHWL